MTAAGVLVVDASVALKWVLPEPGRVKALALLDAYAEGSVRLVAPRLLAEEVASALSKLHRRKEITAVNAQRAFDYFYGRRPAFVDTPAHLAHALTLSLKHQTSLWDSLYLALAIDQRADLVTADRRFHTSIGRHYPFVSLIA